MSENEYLNFHSNVDDYSVLKIILNCFIGRRLSILKEVT